MKNTLAESTMAFLLMTAMLFMMPLLATAQVRCSYDSRGAFCDRYRDAADHETHYLLTQCILELRIDPVVPEAFVQAGFGAAGVIAHNPRLMYCVYGKRGLTITVNGRQQFDIEKIRKNIISFIQQTFQDPSARNALVRAVRSCQVPFDPSRFEVPFGRCLGEALSNRGKNLNPNQDTAEIEYQILPLKAL